MKFTDFDFDVGGTSKMDKDKSFPLLCLKKKMSTQEVEYNNIQLLNLLASFWYQFCTLVHGFFSVLLSL